MAVSNQDQFNLSPSYQTIISQLQNRGNIEASALTPYDVGTSVVKRADQEITKARDFAQQQAAAGKVLVTPDKIQQLTDKLNAELPEGKKVKTSDYSSFVNTWQMPDALQSKAEQDLFAASFKDPQKAMAAAVEPAAAATDVLQNGKTLEQLITNDPSLTLDQKIQKKKQLEKTSYIYKPGKSSSSSTGWSVFAINAKDPNDKIDTGVETNPAGGAGAAPKAIPTSQLDKSNALNDIATKYQDAIDNFDPNYVGPLASRLGKASQYVAGNDTDPKSKFYSAAQGLKNEEMHRLFGSRLTATENTNYAGPALSMSADAFKARMVQAAKQLNKDIAAREASFKASGYTGTVEPTYINIPPEWDKSTKTSSEDQAASDYLTANGKLVTPDTIKAAKSFLAGRK